MSRTYNQFPAEWDGFLAEVVPTTDLDDALSRFLERFPDSGMYHDRETLELLVAKAKLSRTAYGRSLEGRVCRDCGRTFDATFRNQSRCRPCIDARRRDG